MIDASDLAIRNEIAAYTITSTLFVWVHHAPNRRRAENPNRADHGLNWTKITSHCLTRLPTPMTIGPYDLTIL